MTTSADRHRPILVTGATGQIGYEAARALATLGTIVAPGRRDLDLADPTAIRDAIRRVRPGVIVNAAAYTAVDRAELEREVCFAINSTAPGIIADEARRVDALLIHYSTDYVFDGQQTRPYVETDRPAPQSVYGESKLAAERAIEAAGGRYVILRTSWVYAARGTNFVRTMLRLARERESLTVVNDQLGAPTSASSIAAATATIVRRFDGMSALFHLAAAGRTSWYDFARCILERDPHRSEQICREVVPISTAQYTAASGRVVARRPASSVLDCTAIRDRYAIALDEWPQGLGDVLAELAEDRAS